MALITCPNSNCRKTNVSDSGICPSCGRDVASELKKIRDKANETRSTDYCPECNQRYIVRHRSNTNYWDDVETINGKDGHCFVCGFNIFDYISPQSRRNRGECVRCGSTNFDSGSYDKYESMNAMGISFGSRKSTVYYKNCKKCGARQ
jgi:DNA-directed RNA polymerase subunit RPC12/RpoP